jgi:hypothetical protein
VWFTKQNLRKKKQKKNPGPHARTEFGNILTMKFYFILVHWMQTPSFTGPANRTSDETVLTCFDKNCNLLQLCLLACSDTYYIPYITINPKPSHQYLMLLLLCGLRFRLQTVVAGFSDLSSLQLKTLYSIASPIVKVRTQNICVPTFTTRAPW